MTSSTTTSGVAAAAAACVLAAALGACAAPAGAAGDTVRVMVKLAHGSEDAAAIAAEASRVAGVPADHAAAASPEWHALVLHCGAADRCEAAIARLRAAGTIYQAVELDGRKTRAAT